ncbi:hypothetical protein RIF29_30730 [Crotalaria pallida]|uniref:Uncharacterized protein n=1 Tax=Crotalaria pallida TaxID=3830 RepID=A0AAN9EIL1_CROPI
MAYEQFYHRIRFLGYEGIEVINPEGGKDDAEEEAHRGRWKQEASWNWLWDELVAYDLPAVFDYVFKETGQKINYVGRFLVIW